MDDLDRPSHRLQDRLAGSGRRRGHDRLGRSGLLSSRDVALRGPNLPARRLRRRRNPGLPARLDLRGSSANGLPAGLEGPASGGRGDFSPRTPHRRRRFRRRASFLARRNRREKQARCARAAKPSFRQVDRPRRSGAERGKRGAKPIPRGRYAPRVGVLLCPGGRLGSLGSPARLVMPTASAVSPPLPCWGRPESAPRQPRSDGTSQAFHSPAPGSGSGQELARPAGLWNT